MCFKFFSRSLRMNDMTTLGMSAKAIDTMKEMKKPLAEAARFLSFCVTGYGVVVSLNLKLGWPVAARMTAS